MTLDELARPLDYRRSMASCTRRIAECVGHQPSERLARYISFRAIAAGCMRRVLLSMPPAARPPAVRRPSPPSPF